jgi:hypothetical protein
MNYIHKDEEITFDPITETWEWNEETFATLKLAKVAVDAYHKQPALNLKALYAEWGETHDLGPVVVTSVIRKHGRVMAWLRHGGGRRSKEPLESLYEDSPANLALAKELAKIGKEVAALLAKQETVFSKLKKLVIPDTEVQK